MTDIEKIEEFEQLKEFLGSLEIAAEIIPQGDMFGATSLLIALPGSEDVNEELNVDNIAKLHMASASFVEWDEDDSQITKQLLLYTQIPVDVTGVDELSLLRLINEMNRTVRIGHYFYDHVMMKEEKMVQYRMVVTGVVEEPLDGAIVADALLEMGLGFNIMKDELEELTGK